MPWTDEPPKLEPIKLKPTPPHVWRNSEDLVAPYDTEVEVYCSRCGAIGLERLHRTLRSHDGEAISEDVEWSAGCNCSCDWEFWRPFFRPGTEPIAALEPTNVFSAILRERAYQDEKWGTIEEHPHTVGEWLLIIEAELQEAKQGWVKGRGDVDALREILQVSAVAVACMEQHGVIERQ